MRFAPAGRTCAGPPSAAPFAATAAVLAELPALVGLVTLELGGHLVGSADPADRLFAALLERQVDTLGLAGQAGAP